MSGPKLMELRRLRRAALRKHNLEKVAELKARYKRLFEQVRMLKEKLETLGAPVTQEFEGLDQLVRKYDPLLDNQHDVEVVRDFEWKVQSLQEYAADLRLKYEEKLAELENQRAQFERDRQNVEVKKQQQAAAAPPTQNSLPSRSVKKSRTIADLLKVKKGNATSATNASAERIRLAKKEWERVEQIHSLIDSAAAFSSPAVLEIAQHLRNETSSVRDLASWKQRLADAIAVEQADREREDKRRALLESLHELGYETNDQLQTALVQAGRLVFPSPHKSEYGLELVANQDLSQVQAALVRFAPDEHLSEEQRRRDIEREAEWCQDHAILRQKLAARGFEISLKAQKQPGEHPVKIVVDPSQKRHETARPNARSR